MSGEKQFSFAGDVLSKLFLRLLPKESTGYSRFVSGWDRLVGTELAAHVHPKDIVNHAIILESDHPGWSQQIMWKQEKVIRMLNKKYPELEIQRIRVVVDDGSRVQASKQESYENQNGNSQAGMEEVSFTENDQSFFDLLETMRHRSGT